MEKLIVLMSVLFFKYGDNSFLSVFCPKVVFKLDKTGEECLPQIGRQVGSLLHKIWEREDAQDVPATDALVLVEKGLESY